ncbi:MAG TPA: hypothetical protein VFL16_00330 [Steroidobacteraceae bacterium]|nr:hypothetical protein [Steroidobacteraceae bacterium]
MNKRLIFALPCAALLSTALAAAPHEYPLETTSGLRMHNVQATPVKLEGKRGLMVVISDEEKQRIARQPAGQKNVVETLVVIEDSDFTNGVIEAEIAGEPSPDAPEGARGFVGIAFRVKPDLLTYDAFYLRPTNGRADDQERRNHSVQYVSHPDWPWPRLRSETPGRYESYVDLEPGRWTRIRIEVQGERARLFVHGQAQPTLIVNDLKSGTQGRGAIALWTTGSTVAHFRAVRVSAAD